MSSEFGEHFERAPLIDFQLRYKWQSYLDGRSYAERKHLKSLHQCGKFVIKRNENIDIIVDTYGNGRKYATVFNAKHCCSSWACPVCTPYMLSKYAEKANAVIKRKREEGRVAFMITFTVPHTRTQSLAEVYSDLRRTYNSTNNRIFQRNRRNLIGKNEMIKSTEVTYSHFYGWHPHFHILVFCDVDKVDNMPAVVDEWRARWCDGFKKIYGVDDIGLIKMGVDLDFFYNRSVYLSADDGKPRAVETSDYLMSWGADNEIAKTGSTPHAIKTVKMFDLLESGSPRDLALFQEYADVTRGKIRIIFTRNLLANLVIDVSKLEEYTKKNSVAVCSFTSENWSKILELERERKIHYRYYILEVAIETESFGAILGLCERLDLPRPIVCLRKYRTKPSTYAEGNVEETNAA